MRTHRSAELLLLGVMVGLGVMTAGCRTGSSGARSGSESIIEMFSPPSPAEAAELAGDPFNPDNRQKGTLLLANAPFGGERVYVRLYEIGLDDEDAGVRTAAVKALGLHGGPEHVEAVANLASTSEDPILRWQAARTLQRLHNPAVAVPVLIDRLSLDNEENADVRAACATALGQYAQPRVFDALVAALDDPSLTVSIESQWALGVLTGERMGSTPTPWLDWADGRSDLFAGRDTYQYPVFQRERRVAEWFVPWLEPPNETAAAPAGMAGEARRGDDEG